MTRTNAGQLLLLCGEVRGLLGVEGGDLEKTSIEWFDFLHRSWFSSKKSTETMMRGTVNETSVIRAVASMSFFKALFEVGMVEVRR